MGSMSVSSSRCCTFVSCGHHVAVHNAAFCMTCSLGLYEVSLSMCLLGIGMGTMLANFHMCGIIYILFYCLLDLSCSECEVISLYFMYCSVNGSVCFVCSSHP